MVQIQQFPWFMCEYARYRAEMSENIQNISLNPNYNNSCWDASDCQQFEFTDNHFVSIIFFFLSKTYQKNI